MKKFLLEIKRVEAQSVHFRKEPEFELNEQTFDLFIKRAKAGKLPSNEILLDIYDKLVEGGIL